MSILDSAPASMNPEPEASTNPQPAGPNPGGDREKRLEQLEEKLEEAYRLIAESSDRINQALRRRQ